MRKTLFFALLGAGLLGACASPTPRDPLAERDAGLEASRPEAVGRPAPGSPEERAAVDRFTAFLSSDLSSATVTANIRKVYAPRFYFNDTLKTLHDVDSLEKYFIASGDALSSYGLKVEQVASTPEGVLVRWRMSVVFKRFRKGQVQSSIGITHVRFDKDGRVVYHQDYWDSGSNLYEKVPVLGAMIRAVKRRL